MTTPTIFSNTAGNAYQAKHKAQGLLAERAVATIPAATGTGVNVGMIRFQKGFHLLEFDIKTDDLDTGTNVTLNVGYIYDDNVTFTNVPAAFLSASTIAQTGTSTVWPVAAGLLTGIGFTAEAPGYIVVQTAGGATTTSGDVSLRAQFTYDIA